MDRTGWAEAAIRDHKITSLSAASLRGRRVLVAEDEPIIALDLATTLEGAGAEVIVVHTLQNAISVARVEKLSVAITDLRLKDELSYPLCALLQCRDIPFAIYTGYDSLNCKYNRCIIPKPTAANLIVERLAILTRNRPEKSIGHSFAVMGR